MTIISLELTTHCNYHCKFCTHENLISSGARTKKHMSPEDAKYIIDKISIKYPNINWFIPVGLGEPFTYPYLIEILKYANKKLSDTNISLNTNGSLINTEIIGKIDYLTISLCFPLKNMYENSVNKNFNFVVNKIQNFLIQKGNSPPITKLHIFDNPLNRILFPYFYLKWWKYLGNKDYCALYPFETLVGKSCPKESQKNNIMIDINGNIYSSCMGVWYPSNETKHLKIGNIFGEN